MKIVEKKEIAGAVLFISWLASYQGKKIENCNSVGAGAQKVGKVWPNADPNFSNI